MERQIYVYLIYFSTKHPVCPRSSKIWGNAGRFLLLSYGQEELSLAISDVNYLLQEIKFQGRKQSRIDDHFLLKNNEMTSTRSIINLNCSSHRHQTIEIYMIFCIFIIHVIVIQILYYEYRLLVSILLLHSLMQNRN